MDNPYLASLAANEALRIPLGMIVAGGLLAIVFGNTSRPRAKPAVKHSQNIPLPKRGRAWFARHQKPVRVGGVTFDRAWRHIGIIGTTGSRKSTALAMLAEQLNMPCVIITGDHAPPLENWTRSAAGWVWRARGDVAWYPWGGPLELAVQRAEYMHPATSGDVGVGRSMFKAAAREAWAAADARGEVRTLAQLRAALPSVVKGQTSAMMSENWTARLRELEESLGASLGAQLDIVEALRQRTSVMVSLNSFQDTSNRGRFASIAVLEALRAADTLGNIGVIIDEVGLIGGELFDDAVRVLRVRLCTGIFASQLFDDFPPAVRDNIGVYFLGQQSGAARSSRNLSSETTFGRIPPEAFGEHALPHGRFYVVHGGRVEQATIPTWTDRWVRPPAELPAPLLLPVTPLQEKVSVTPITTIPEVALPPVATVPRVVHQGPPEMPECWRGQPDMSYADRQQLLNIWMRHTFPDGLDGCHISTYAPTSKGRIQVPFQGTRWTNYVLSLALHEGRDLRQVRMLTAAGELTVDHVCEDKRCSRPDHLAWESRSDNTRLYFERRRLSDETRGG